jgi:PAS domain S-box-containing protein
MHQDNDTQTGERNPAWLQQVSDLKAALQELRLREEERGAALAKANEELRREIAYRTRVEETLRADVERFQTMLGGVKDYAILMLDTAGYVVTWNDGAEQILGYAAAEIVGRDFSCFYPSQDVERGKPAKALQVAAAEGGYEEEGWRMRREGALFWASVVITALRDGQGVLRGFAKVTRDITARRRTEEKLQLQARVIEKMTESVIVADEAGRILTTNPATERMFGYERGELIGRHLSGLREAEEGEARQAVAAIMAAARGGSPWRGEVSRRRKDGAVFLTRTQVSVFEEEGRPHFFAILEDITERRRVEESLRASEERFSSAFEYAAIGMALVGLDGRWLKVNRALCELVGYSEAALLMRTFQDITHPDDLETDLENLRQLVAGKIPSYQMEKRYFHLRGHLVRVLLSVSLVREPGGRPLYFISQVQDITARERLQARLLQSQKLETVGRLAGGVAHEFNSLLTVILGQSECLLSELPPASPMRHDAEDIIRAAERAAALTQQLLAYGRQQFLRLETLDLNQVIASMAGTFRLIMGGVVQVRVTAGQGLWAVQADAGQIEQVIMNLAMNAHQAMPGGGQLTLETANVTVDQPDGGEWPELKPGGYVMLAITDTGTGMSEEVKARLFEPFFSTKDVGKGTGLGLATCYGIIQQCGGNISVRSAPGQGTTFKIYLPQAVQPVEVPAAPDVTGE